ncbi:MAG: metallophosphoesterase family protein, partial [Planctomycetales bacterium]|nr:metallophosphoesterase family protein [Planctomycetales bacterium]
FGNRGGDPNVKLVLRVRYDDGFIAYLNGVEIARANVASGSGASATGIEGHDANDEEEFKIDASELVKLLRRGTNIISIEGHNNAVDSSDFTLDPEFGYEAFGRYRGMTKKEDWQYLLGEPSENWTTAEIEAARSEGLPGNATRFVLHYGKRGQPMSQTASVDRRLFADTGNVIQHSALKHLEPDTTYAFELRKEDTGSDQGRRYFFRTAPSDADRPLSFVTGGDMYGTRAKLDTMNSEAGKQNAAFALLGGDLAYANGSDANRWYDWIDSWARFAITAEDCCLPMIAVIGNHECSRNLNDVPERERRDFDPVKNAKFYRSLFQLPNDKTNFVVDFGNYMSIVCLDSYHTQTPQSQAPWLEETLQSRVACPNLFVCYHRPAFGTLVKDDVEDIRKYWSGLFEHYGVDVVFENDH